VADSLPRLAEREIIMDTPARALVSAVICTRNRPDKIGQSIEMVLANRYPNFDLTIIDQSTNDETETIVRAISQHDARVRYQRMTTSGLSRAYNQAIVSTSGDTLVFTDDDCLAPPDWIDNVVTAFGREPDGELLYGQVIAAFPEAGGDKLTPVLVINKPERLDRKHGFRVFGMGANFAARRSLFERIGLFDVALGGGGPLKSSQDFDLAYRAYRHGAVTLLRPEVVMRHDGRREIEDWPTLLLAYGFGDGAFYSKHVRCRDPYAMWLTLKVFAKTTAKVVIKRALGEKTLNAQYLKGLVHGVRGGMKFNVDRATLLYTQER
jgi:glycosyltransferase involved in cell wall biosynthesis